MHRPIIPELYAPFPPRINPHVDQSNELTQKWVMHFKLHEGPAFKKYQQDRLTWMTARFYPTASKERLFITDKFNTLLFAADDLMDHQDQKSSIINNRKSLEAFIYNCLSIMKGDEPEKQPSTGVMAALSNVWDQLKLISTPAWQERFSNGIRQMFDAALWAYDNVAAHRLPSAADFYQIRPFLGAANTSTDMIQATEQIYLPDEILLHPVVAELTRLCQITVCLANDLFSLGKEMAHQDQHNMVTILQRERGLTLQQAIKETVNIHNADVTRFITLLDTLPTFDEYDSELRRYISILTALMRGNIDWSVRESGRYPFVYGRNQSKPSHMALDLNWLARSD